MTNSQPSTSTQNDNQVSRKGESCGEIKIDVDSILKRIGNDRELMNELIGIYLDDISPLMSQLQAAVGAQSCDRAVRATHNIKGLASNFGVTPVSLSAMRLERHALAGEWHEFRSNLDELAGHTSALTRALQRLRDGGPS